MNGAFHHAHELLFAKTVAGCSSRSCIPAELNIRTKQLKEHISIYYFFFGERFFFVVVGLCCVFFFQAQGGGSSFPLFEGNEREGSPLLSWFYWVGKG